MASSKLMAIFLIAIGIIQQQAISQAIQDANRLSKLRLPVENLMSASQQSAALFNQRPTQFISSLQPAQVATAHSRGALIMPANNQIQAGNFHLTAETASVRSQHQHTDQQQQQLLSASLAANDYQANDNQILTQPADLSKEYSHKGLSGGNSSMQVEQSHGNNNSLMGGSLQSDLELALRQANGDESVFQQSPAMPVLGHTGYDQWSFARSSIHQSTTLRPVYLGETRPEQQEDAKVKSAAFVTQSTDSTSTNTQQDLDRAPATASGGHLPELSSVPVGLLHEASMTPATVNSDYFFSSAERAPINNERASSNVWWSLGIGADFERANNLTRDDYFDYCARSELLISNKQRFLCKSHPKIMAIVARGLKMAIEECQSRFTSNRWNCSLILHESLPALGEQVARGPIFGEVMKQPNRERSFLNAIIAAALAHSMTKACSQGELPEECSCDKRIKSKNSKGKIEWVACSDDIDFGARFSRDFTDSGADNDSDTSSMISAHNYEVGRRVFKSATDITCSCLNGDNGLCQTKRCWKHVAPFTDIGDELMKRYDSATHVQLSNRDPHKLRPVRRGVRRPKRKDLVYIDESPDYCSPDSRLGVLGTQNRRCNSTSSGPDSCSLLCCGRGYQMVLEELEEECNCKFVWCCQVKCDKCKRQVTNDVCN